MPRSLPPIHMTDPLDQQLSGYRVLVGQAVIALILGLLSPLALIDPFLMIVPILGVIFGVLAIRRIKSNTTAMAGRKRAILGILISLFFIAAAPLNTWWQSHILFRHARQLSDAWFKHLLDNEPEKALEMTYIPPPVRTRNWRTGELDEPPPARTRQEELDFFIKATAADVLLALGPRAQIRFYQDGDISETRTGHSVTLFYAVTYDSEPAAGIPPERTSFFIKNTIEQFIGKFGAPDVWKLKACDGGARPEGW
jgi:hypothetical protein